MGRWRTAWGWTGGAGTVTLRTKGEPAAKVGGRASPPPAAWLAVKGCAGLRQFTEHVTEANTRL